jgi:hypothetical protein
VQLPGWHGSGLLKRLVSLRCNRIAIVIFVVGPQGQLRVGPQCRDMEWKPSGLPMRDVLGVHPDADIRARGCGKGERGALYWPGSTLCAL